MQSRLDSNAAGPRALLVCLTPSPSPLPIEGRGNQRCVTSPAAHEFSSYLPAKMIEQIEAIDLGQVLRNHLLDARLHPWVQLVQYLSLDFLFGGKVHWLVRFATLHQIVHTASEVPDNALVHFQFDVVPLPKGSN